jgi:hypothetical protein
MVLQECRYLLLQNSKLYMLHRNIEPSHVGGRSARFSDLAQRVGRHRSGASQCALFDSPVFRLAPHGLKLANENRQFV